MELESLETLFKVNWDNVKEQLQRMQEAFQQFGDLTANTAQQSMQKTEQAMDLSESLRKLQNEFQQINQAINGSFSKTANDTGEFSKKIVDQYGNVIEPSKKAADSAKESSESIKKSMQEELDNIEIVSNGITKKIGELNAKYKDNYNKAFDKSLQTTTYYPQDVGQKVKQLSPSEQATAYYPKEMEESVQKAQEASKNVSSSIKEAADSIQEVVSQVTKTVDSNASETASSFKNMSSEISEELERTVQTINSKMEQAKAAQAKINELLSQKNSLSNAQQTGTEGVKIDNQVASAQAKMVRYQNQAKSLAQQMRKEFDAIPDSLKRISTAMDQNEGKINTLKDQLKRLETTYSDLQASAKITPGSEKNQSKLTSYEKSIMSTQDKIRKLINSNDELSQSYAYIEDRVEPLKSALSKVNTEMNEDSSSARKAASSMNEMSESASHASMNMSKMSGGGFFNKISNAVKKATSSMNMFGHESESSMSKASRSGRECYGVLSSIRQQLMFLPSMLIVYGLLWNGISSLATGTAQAFEVNKKFAASLETIKDNLLTAFYPIYNYVLPAVNALMSSLEKATSWLAQFTSALTGMSFSAAKSGAKNLKEQVSALNDTSSSSSAASKAIKKANEQIREENRQNSLAVKHQNEEIEESNRKARAEVQKENAQITASNKAATESYEKQKKAAEELTESLMGFDELNILDKNQSNDISKPESQSKESYTSQPTVSSPDSIPTESTDSDDAEDDTPFTPSSSVFDSAADAANRLKKILGELFDPMKEAWADKGQEVMDAAKYAAKELGKDFEDVGRSFMSVWTNGTGKETMENLLQLVADLLNIIGDIGKAFDEAWNHGNAGTKLIQTIFDSLNDVLVLLHDVATSFRQAFNDNNLGEQIISNIIKLLTTVASTVGTIAKAFDDAWKHGNLGTELFKAILTAANNVIILINDIASSFQKAFSSNLGVKMFSDILTIAKDVFQVIGNLAGQFDKAWQAGNTGTGIFKAILGIIDVILDDLKDMADYTVAWSSKLNFTPLLKSIQTLLNAIKPITKDVFDGLKWGYENILLPLAKFTITELVPNFLNALSAALKAVNVIVKAAEPTLNWMYNSLLKPLAELTGWAVNGALKLLADALNGISSWADKHQTLMKWLVGALVTMVTLKYTAKGYNGLITDLGKLIAYNEKVGGLKKLISTLFSNITGLGDLKKAWEYTKSLANVPGLEKVASGLKSAWGALKNWSVWSKLAAAGQAILNAAMELNPYVLLAAAIAAVVVGLVALYKHDKKFQKFCNDLYKSITKWLGNAIKWLEKNWGGVALLIVNPIAGGLVLLYNNNPKFQKWVNDLWTGLQKNLKSFKKNWGKFWSGVGDKMSTIWNDMKTDTKEKWGKIKDHITTASEGAWKDAKGSWDTLKGKTSTAWDDIKTGTSNKWDDVKKYVSGKAEDAHKGASSAWDNIKSYTSDAWDTVKQGTSDKWGNIKESVRSLAETARDKAGGAWDTIKSHTSDAWTTVSGGTQSTWQSIHDKISNMSDQAKAKALTAWQSLQDNTPGYFRNVKGYASDAWTAITNGAGGLGSNIASGIRSGFRFVQDAMADLKKYIIDPVKKAVGKIKDGINWVLNKLGAGSTNWGWFNWANGTANHPGGLAMVNDENSADYRESYQLPNGKQGIFPAVRNLVLPLPAGTQIKSAAATQASISKLMPHYAGGIGDFNFDFSGLEDALKSLSSIDWSSLGGDIWSGVTDEFDSILSDVTHPKKLLDYIVNKFMSYDWGWTDTQTKLAKGSVNTLEDGLTGWAKNILKKFGSASGGTIPSGNHQNLMKEAGIPSSWFNDMNWLVTTESGWKTNATNPSSGAYGLPQSLPGSKMASAGSDWRTNPVTQLKWMYDYVSGRYGTAANAVRFHKINGWYANGGFVDAEGLYGMAEGNKPEMVLPLTDKNRTLQLIKEAMSYIGENFTSGLQMPTALTADTGTVSTETSANSNSSANTAVQSGGISQLSTNLVNAIVQGLQMATGSSNDSSQPININLTVNMDSDQLGQAAIKGINSVNAKNHRNMLNL